MDAENKKEQTLGMLELAMATRKWSGVERAYAELGKETKQDEFYEPEHYHKHKTDTITFLQEGFPPEVFAHFATACIVKYAQRYPYKNGREDLVKLVDYAKRLLDWHDKTHS